ncbi:MAG TPA: hypothetical protein VGO50_05160 [Pyrinomonadaceae bacterium]|jgi:hypothetical protein|nr:hypothetical protein [Pyrinomonadaceae bacterium]
MNKKKTKDENLLAKGVIDDIIKLTESETFERVPEKNPAAVYLGRRGGLKGGKARAEKLTPARRKEIALKAARARWDKPEK